MSRKLGWFIIIVFALIPTLIWCLIQPISSRFLNISVTTTSIGQLAALIGITFFLNTRLKFIENAFGGLDKVYKTHHLLGTISFLLLLSHPLFLAVKYTMFSLNSLLSFLFFGLNLATDFGEFALLAMILSLTFTFFINLKYDKWKIIHQFLGLALLFASIHVLLLTSDISRNAILKAYVLIFVSIGIASFCYKTLFHTKLIKNYKYEIKEIKHLGDVNEIKLTGENFNYLPGQFVFVRFPSISYEYHPFTISSIKKENYIEFSIKSSGDYTEKIKGLKAGDRALIEGPYGRFYSKGKEQIWIAGGIGITPFLSFAENIK
jgi:predicted ferric reductase